MNKPATKFSMGIMRGLGAGIALSTVLAACGGDNTDNNAPPATSQVPASASASVGGFIAYLELLVASSADMLEPVDTSMVTGPTDDTSEPVPVQ